MAGSSVALVSDIVYPSSALHGGANYPCAREVVVLCTGDDGTGAFPATDLCSISGLKQGPLSGWMLYAFETDPGTTGPDDNSDLVLNSANGTDMTATQGANIIDNATNNLVFLTNPFYIGPSLTQGISGSSVNSATVTIKYYLKR